MFKQSCTTHISDLSLEQQYYVNSNLLTREQVLDPRFNDVVKRGIEIALKNKSLNQEQKTKKVEEAYENILA